MEIEMKHEYIYISKNTNFLTFFRHFYVLRAILNCNSNFESYEYGRGSGMYKVLFEF